MARTALFNLLQSFLVPQNPASQRLDDRRRLLLKGTAGALLLSGAFGTLACGGKAPTPVVLPPPPKYEGPRIVIVGAGLAGLSAARTLRVAGIPSRVFEGSARVGGRVLSTPDMFIPGQVVEQGGEFIGSKHNAVLQMARELGLELIDREANAPAGSPRQKYFFGGQRRSAAEVEAALAPVLALVEKDRAALPADWKIAGGEAERLDNLTIAAYLDALGVSGWVRALIDVAYTVEYGLDPGEQSALNLISTFGVEQSDSRYSVRGGSQQLAERMAAELEDSVQYSMLLEAVRSRTDGGFLLTFRSPGGDAMDVRGDVVILALPFTMLREVNLRVEMREEKYRALRDLGHGGHSKLFLPFAKRIWREQGSAGSYQTDAPWQSCWDSSQGQPGDAGTLTFMMGGTRPQSARNTRAERLAAEYLPSLEPLWPSIGEQYLGTARQIDWSRHPFALASRATYLPGQWSSIRGLEGESIGNLHFAGEHCSLEFQGTMNGAVESGISIARAVAARITATTQGLLPQNG